jgi:hypothetical protein
MSRRIPGFRFSVIDGAVIALFATATVALRPALGENILLGAGVLGHFFLFCNVFRVRRSIELAWAALFLVNTGAWAMAGGLAWWKVLAAQAPATLVAIGLELRSRAYHGVGWERINPQGARAWVGEATRS